MYIITTKYKGAVRYWRWRKQRPPWTTQRSEAFQFDTREAAQDIANLSFFPSSIEKA